MLYTAWLYFVIRLVILRERMKLVCHGVNVIYGFLGYRIFFKKCDKIYEAVFHLFLLLWFLGGGGSDCQTCLRDLIEGRQRQRRMYSLDLSDWSIFEKSCYSVIWSTYKQGSLNFDGRKKERKKNLSLLEVSALRQLKMSGVEVKNGLCDRLINRVQIIALAAIFRLSLFLQSFPICSLHFAVCTWGPSIKYVRKILGFFDPLPPWTHS